MSHSKVKPKILLKQSIAGAYKDLNDHRKGRFRQRQSVAEQAGLNFRYNGRPIKSHGLNRLYGDYREDYGKCMVCGKSRYECTCKIEVRDQTGTLVRELEL